MDPKDILIAQLKQQRNAALDALADACVRIQQLQDKELATQRQDP